MNRATFKGKVRDRYGYAVHLFYEYRGYEYMVTDEHNGYSEPMWLKHKIEQDRIDQMIERKNNQKAENNSNPEDDAQVGFDLFWDYVEGN